MEPTSGLTGRAGGVRKTYKNLVATGPGIVSIISISISGARHTHISNHDTGRGM